MNLLNFVAFSDFAGTLLTDACVFAGCSGGPPMFKADQWSVGAARQGGIPMVSALASGWRSISDHGGDGHGLRLLAATGCPSSRLPLVWGGLYGLELCIMNDSSFIRLSGRPAGRRLYRAGAAGHIVLAACRSAITAAKLRDHRSSAVPAARARSSWPIFDLVAKFTHRPCSTAAGLSFARCCTWRAYTLRATGSNVDLVAARRSTR